MKVTKLFVLLLIIAFPLVVSAQNLPDDTTLVIAQSIDITTLEPFQQSSRAESNIFGHVYATLLDVNSDGEFTMYAADSMSLSEDRTEYTFTLKQGLTCQDGSPITADDVAFSFQRANDPANEFTGHQAGYVMDALGYKDVRVDDEYTVTIMLNGPQPIAPGLIADVYILCREAYEGLSLEEAATTVIGSGPYRFVEWVPDDYVLLEKVEGFTLLEPTFDRLVWRVIPEASTRVAELLTGNVDIIANVPPDQIPAVDNSGSAEVQVVNGVRRIYVGFSFNPFFADAEGFDAIQNTDVRVAMQYAVDVPTICQTLLGADCRRATSLVNPPNDHPTIEPYPYDPAMAEQLLDEAGYPRGEDGVRFSITLQAPRGRYVNDANVALAIGQYLSDVGIDTTVDIIEWSEYVPLIRAHEAGPLFMLGTGGSTWSAISDMSDLSTPEGATNYTEWKNADWFERYPQMLAITDAAEQRAMIDEMLEIFYNDPPWLMLYFQPDYYGVSNRIDWQARRDEVIDVTEASLAAS